MRSVRQQLKNKPAPYCKIKAIQNIKVLSVNQANSIAIKACLYAEGVQDLIDSFLDFRRVFKTGCVAILMSNKKKPIKFFYL